MKNIEVSDLDAVAHFEEDLVLFIFSEDENIPTSLCVQANFDTQKFDLIQPLGLYLESNSYLPIQDEDTRISHRQRIMHEISEDVIAAMLADFAQKRSLNFEKMGISDNKTTGWVPGG
jgi:hypothetical protein